MALQFWTNLNLNKNEIQNAVLQPLAVAPGSPKLGQIYFNSADHFIYRYDGTAWGKAGVVYSHNGTAGAVIVGLDDNGTVTTKNVIALTLAGYTPVKDGHVTEGMTLEAAVKALDQAILDAAAGNGEVNQNAFSSVKAGDATIAATGKTDTLEIAAGKNIKLTPDAATKKLTIEAEIPADVVTDEALSSELQKYLPNAGGTMTGGLDMGSHKIAGVTAGTEDTDAVNYKQLQDAIAGLGTVFDLKGEKNTAAELPSTGNETGDVWYVKESSAGYVWLVTADHPSGYWEPFGPAINLSGYLQIANIKQQTGDATDAPMSQKATTKAIEDAVGALVKTATGTIETNATTVQVSFTGTLIHAFVKNAAGEIVMTDMTVSGNKVVFTTGTAPDSVLTCTVVSA